MKNSFKPQKPKIVNNNSNFETYDINNNSLLPHCETEIGDNIHSTESLSNIIDVITKNNLNLFYQDDSTNFKRNIDNLNLKFYLETEKILSSNNINNSNNLFLILFKQITLYIKEIERLNVIILGMKKDEKSKDKLASFLERREMDFETKDNIIKALQYSNNTLEKKINNLIVSESNLKQENMRLIKENLFYKNNNSSNSNINNNNSNINNNNNSHTKILNSNDKKKIYYVNDKVKNKKELFNNKKYIKNNFKNNFHNKINNDSNNNGNNTNIINNNIIIPNNNSLSNNNNNKIINKINKDNSNINNIDEKDSKSIIISVKRDEHLLVKRHRRNYSDQIGVGVLIQDNEKNKCSNGNNGNNSKKNIPIKKNNNNKNNIISLGSSTPKASPTQIKNNHFSNANIKQNAKYKNSKSIKNDNKDKDKKIFTKKKTDNITNKSKHIDLISNNDKDCSMTKYSSSVFNKSNIYSQGNGNISINITENNYDFLIENEIDDLTMFENLLNQIKDYIKGNISGNNPNTQSISNIIKINCNNNSNTNIKKGLIN